jgi:iron complex outermembrane receptor protein
MSYRVSSGAVCAAALLLSAGAMAQDQTDQAVNGSTTGGQGLTEVVVTAERVQTLESRTPISMEVLSQNELTANDVVNVQKLAQQDPSVNFDTGNGGGYITIRGINGSGGIGPAVPVAFDDFYYNTSFVFYNTLYDVGELQVLRGPQGTLFGRNTSGGLIEVNSNNPTKTFGGYGEVTFANYNEIDAQGALNLPLSDSLQVRLAFSSAQHGGYRQGIIGFNNYADNEDAKSGRIKIAWQPTEHLNLIASYQYTHLGGTGTVDNILDLPAYPAGVTPPGAPPGTVPSCGPQPPADNPPSCEPWPTHEALTLKQTGRTYNLAFSGVQDIDDHLMQLHIDYALPAGITLSYLGGYDTQFAFHNTPFVGPDAIQYGVPDTLEFPGFSTPFTNNQELRLASNQNQRLIWQTGVYYFRAWNPESISHVNDIGTPANPPASTDLVTLGSQTDQNSYAWYGQIGLNMGPTQLSLGLRDTRDYVAQTDLECPGDGVSPCTLGESYSKWTWHAGFDWNLSDRHLLYVKADTGYRAGAFNLNIPCNCTGGPFLPTTIEPYKPEYVIAYEVGSKNRFFNERLLFNIDGFYEIYQGEQLPQANAGGVFTVNAANTNIYGIESQLSAIANPIGRLDFNLTWLHARFDSQVFTNGLGFSYNIGGNELLLAPSISLTAAFEHDWMLSSGTLAARVQTKWQDGMYFDFYNFADSYQPGYTRTDAHLIYTTASGKYQFDAFVQNIENSLVLADESESFSPPLIQPGTYNYDFQAPRIYGLSVTAHF